MKFFIFFIFFMVYVGALIVLGYIGNKIWEKWEGK